MTTETKTTISPDEAFSKSAEALTTGKIDIAREWRQLGEALVGYENSVHDRLR